MTDPAPITREEAIAALRTNEGRSAADIVEWLTQRLNVSDEDTQIEVCDECEAELPNTGPLESSAHAESCSLHVENIENPLWLNDEVQACRLVDEIMANVPIGRADWRAVEESMDLSESELDELIDRLRARWEAIKRDGPALEQIIDDNTKERP